MGRICDPRVRASWQVWAMQSQHLLFLGLSPTGLPLPLHPGWPRVTLVTPGIPLPGEGAGQGLSLVGPRTPCGWCQPHPVLTFLCLPWALRSL